MTPMTLRHSWARAQSSLRSRLRPKLGQNIDLSEPVEGSSTILMIGACQGLAIGRAMTLLCPEASVSLLPVHRLRERFPRIANLVAYAQGFDAVFAYGFTMPFLDGGTFETFRAACPLVTVPPIIFSAFHPDLVYVGPLDKPDFTAIVSGPMGHYHSALTLFAYLEELPPGAALRLFTPEVYAALGYLDAWSAASDGLLAIGRDAGYPLDAHLARWMRRGCFMHSINHPKMFVMADLARGLLDRAGIPHDDCDLDSYMADTLIEQGTWPVYGPIAAHYGVAGSNLFLKPASRRTGPARTMTREAFVHASYAGYDGLRRDGLLCERVARWRADGAVRALLREAAGG